MTLIVYRDDFSVLREHGNKLSKKDLKSYLRSFINLEHVDVVLYMDGRKTKILKGPFEDANGTSAEDMNALFTKLEKIAG